MAFAVKKLGDDPIIIVSLDVPLIRYLSNLRSTYAQVDQIATACAPPLYRIIDTRSLDLSFSDILLWMEEQAAVPRGGILDSRLTSLIVGTHPLLPAWSRRIKLAFNIDTPVYPYLELALIDIRTRISAQRGRNNSFH